MPTGFHIITFGCQMNVCDSQWIARALGDAGWRETPEHTADVVIINTCSVREKPEQKVYSILGRLQEEYAFRELTVAVGGCVAQQVGEGLWKRFPCVRLVFGTDGVAGVPAALTDLLKHPKERRSMLSFLDTLKERDPHFSGSAGSAQAFVTIMQGCDNFCAYCIVPHVRGRQKSRSGADVLAECETLVRSGVREITLLGQNVNSFGLDRQGNGIGFAELLRRIDAIEGLDRLRFTTSHPKDLSSEVIESFGSLRTLCPHLHLPLQSGSDRVLKAMGRKYTTGRYQELVDALRRSCPQMALTTDLIVGFPGETEEDFERTLDMMRKVNFSASFSFLYCDRPGVRSARMADKISEEIKKERLSRVQALQDRLTSSFLAEQVGKEVEVLVEGKSRVRRPEGVSWHGKDRHGRTVNAITPGNSDLVGRMTLVRIEAAKKHSLFGRVTGQPW